MISKKFNIGDLVEILYVGQSSSYFPWTDNPVPGIYTLGGGTDNMISLIESIEMIEELTRKKINPVYKNERFGDLHYFVADFTKFKNATGWEPKVRPREGINYLLKWVQNNENFFFKQ